MLVRAGHEGEWLPLQPITTLPPGGLRALCGADASTMLELDTPLPVAAFGPWPHGAAAGVDAVCLTSTGDIELLVATFDESPRDTLWRLLDVAGALRGTSLEAFASHCTELGGERSITRWLHARVGGDAAALEARLRHVLESGEFGFVVVTSSGSGAGDLGPPLQYVQGGLARVRVFEVEVLGAGNVQAIETVEATLQPQDAAPTAAPAPAALHVVPAAVEPERPATAPAPDVAVVAEPEARPAPEVVVEPVIAPVRAVEPEPEPVAAPAAEPVVEPEPAQQLVVEPETEPEPEPEPVVQAPVSAIADAPEAAPTPAPEVPSDVDAFLKAVDRLDHRTSAYLRWMHDSLLSLVDEAEYTTDGDLCHVAGWVHGSERLPLWGLDSRGQLLLVVSTLPPAERAEFATEVAGLVPDADGAAYLEAGWAEVDVPAHLDDQTLVEYLVDNLVEALPGGRAAFGTGPAEPIDEDFFAGMSASQEADEVSSAVNATLGGQGPDDVDVPVEAPKDEAVKPPQQGGGSRWLRRRGAA